MGSAGAEGRPLAPMLGTGRPQPCSRLRRIRTRLPQVAEGRVEGPRGAAHLLEMRSRRPPSAEAVDELTARRPALSPLRTSSEALAPLARCVSFAPSGHRDSTQVPADREAYPGGSWGLIQTRRTV